MAMQMPYVPPEQIMRDRADYARKGIARGRSVVAITYNNGVLFIAENPSATLRKVSEIYDRIAFAAVGKYNEFEQLRVAGVRMADVRGYQYAREDVTARSIANAYANALGAAFTEGSKPFEVELLVAEVTPDDVELYHILYDGSITDETGYVAIGGSTDPISQQLQERFSPGLDRDGAIVAAEQSLAAAEERSIEPRHLEVAGLDRTRGRRKYFRLPTDDVAAILENQPSQSQG